MIVSDEDIDKGFDHLETVTLLHYQKTHEEYWEAIKAFQEWLGMDEDARTALSERMKDFLPEGRKESIPYVIIGFMAGLSTAQYATESF